MGVGRRLVRVNTAGALGSFSMRLDSGSEGEFTGEHSLSSIRSSLRCRFVLALQLFIFGVGKSENSGGGGGGGGINSIDDERRQVFSVLE